MDLFCKACLVKCEDPSELLQYTEKNRRLFVYSTGLQVKRNDALPFQLCHACFLKMKMSCQFKKQCRTSDKRLNNFLSLKEAGEVTDLSNYLQNHDEPSLYKFPLNGTPSFQKAKDDDNVSTSTSIRNFMADFLREDEVPDAEAHIIREMIEQEADVLDDSLDSQWLQDDISIASDFGFSPFSTPLQKHNYQPLINYSPVKKEEPQDLPNPNTEKNIFAAKKLFYNPKSCLSSETESPRSRADSDQNTFIAAKKILLQQRKDTKSQEGAATKLESDVDQDTYIAKKRILLNKNETKMNKKKQILRKGKDMKTYLAAKSICLDSNSDISGNESRELANMSPNSDIEVSVESLNENSANQEQIPRKGFYIENAEISDIERKDSIDKNLEKLLNSTNHDIISLSALLASPSSETLPNHNEIIATPSVHQGLSGANTPTIANILFGEQLDDNQSTIEQHPEQVKNSVSDKDSNADILEDFFVKDTGEYVGANTQNQDEIFEEYNNEKLDALAMPGKSQFDLTNFSCKKCKVGYKSERGLKIHFVKAHNSKIITQRNKEPRIDLACEFCGQIFHLASNLSRHRRNIHLKPKTAQKCELCSLQFTSKAKLNMHMKTHRKENENLRTSKKSLVCPICGCVSTQASNLKVHIARHNKQYAVTCDHCEMGFYRKTDLQIHMRAHMDTKPFQCPHCPERVRRKDQLVRHVKKHIGENLHVCEICKQTYSSSASLKHHMEFSMKCNSMKIDAAIKANKVIEESIDQLYVEEVIVVGNEKVKEFVRGMSSPKNSKNTNTSSSNAPVEVPLEDLIMDIGDKQPMVQDDDDKVSLSEMFTIPKIIKED